MSAELHLPDLPEVPLVVGAEPGSPAPRPRTWRQRLHDLAITSLPLLLMALLAAGTWYLSRISPRPATSDAAAAPASEPDYTMRRFSLQRFGPDGQMDAQVEGAYLRHFPETDEIEIDTVQVHALDAQGRDLVATARQARVGADRDVITLQGGAVVRLKAPGQTPAEISGEHLVLQVKAQRVVAERPVRVVQGASRFEARALTYDGRSRQLVLEGPARVVLTPQGAAARRPAP